jgi:hypothetical protein
MAFTLGYCTAAGWGLILPCTAKSREACDDAPVLKCIGDECRRPYGMRGVFQALYSTALREITSRYHSALSLGVRCWVLKST